ncbi:class A sortase [Lysinibacillus sp. MHQ-1]|nr:class A sortase [Lysinibacillus sp. MHQ-1]
MKPNQHLGQGNYALAGHYFEEKDILFSPLYQTQIGDIIYVTDMSNVYEYKLTTKKNYCSNRCFHLGRYPQPDDVNLDYLCRKKAPNDWPYRQILCKAIL